MLQWYENLELHHKWITWCWSAAFTFGEYLCQIVDDFCNRIKSVTFCISNVKRSHDTGIIHLHRDISYRGLIVLLRLAAMRWECGITSQINGFIWLAAVRFGEYLCQRFDRSLKKIKLLTFLITNVKIGHHRWLNLFWWKDQFVWINSHVPSSCNDMRICN